MAETARPSLSNIARRLGVTLLGVVHTRLALAGLELEEEIERLLRLLLSAFAIVLFATLALLVFSLLIVIASPEGYRLDALGLLVLVYAACAVAFGWKLRRDLKHRPPMFAATLAELEQDRASLRESVKAEHAEAHGHEESL